MKVQRFESEYDASLLPQIVGDPLANDTLTAQAVAMHPGVRLDSSRQTLILDAVRDFYLAKRYIQSVLQFSGFTNAVVPGALSAIGWDLLRLAIVTVASVNDNTGERTKSLPHSINALRVALGKVNDKDVSTELNELKRVSSDINADRVLSLKYLRHLRNKWAGHASLDRNFDDWAQADTTISLPLIEDALVRLVNAHDDLSRLIDSSEVLRARVADPQDSPDSGAQPAVLPMKVDWGPAIVWALGLQEWAGRAVEALVDQLQSPPGYGSTDDTDWRADSEHQRRRSLVDEAARGVSN